MHNTDTLATMNAGSEHGGQLPPGLTAADVEVMGGVATLLVDVLPAFAVSVTQLVNDQLSELPRDDATVKMLVRAADGNPREILSMLRANIPPTAHETPVEALEHVRFMQQRGVGWTSFLGIYQYGAAMFRNMVHLELDAQVQDSAQLARIKAAGDEYMFEYLRRASRRLAVEYGLLEEMWDPATDEVLANPASAAAARALRDEQIARGTWVAASPEQSRAHHEAELALERFAETIERAAVGSEVGRLLTLAGTRIVITLADEPDLSVTLLLDRTPIEVAQGVVDADARIWIASVDLNRIWAQGFYLPMAISRGRVRMEGAVRPFLRVAPILRALGDTHDDVVASVLPQEES